MPKKNIQFVAKKKDIDKRLDVFLSEQLDMSRSQVQKLIADDGVLVNGKAPKKSGNMLKEGAIVKMVEPKKKEEKVREIVEERPVPQIQILAETRDYIVVHKPSGLLVHPTEADEKESMVTQLLLQFPEIAGIGENPVRPGIVHRLDKEASGVLVVARTKSMYKSLKAQFQKRTVEKEYIILVHGLVVSHHDRIDFPIDRGHDGMMVARPLADTSTLRGVSHEQPGKESLTEFFVEQRIGRYSLLRVLLHTGRTHQIRVHMRAYGHPVVGDTLYFNKKLNRKRDLALGRLFLHAKRLCFDDRAGERQCFEDPMPQELQDFLASL